MHKKSISFFGFINKVSQHRRALTGAVAFFCLLGGGSLSYHWYKAQIEQSAYSALKKAIKVYETPIITGKKNANTESFTSVEEKLAAVEAAFKEAYDQHCSSGIAPLFLAYRGDIALDAQNFESAYKFYQEAAEKSPAGGLRDLLSVKVALIGIDTKNPENCARGIETLKKIALDSRSAASAYAYYQWGLYYWHEKDFSKAKSIWQDFLVAHTSQDTEIDYFVHKAKSKLALITVEN